MNDICMWRSAFFYVDGGHASGHFAQTPWSEAIQLHVMHFIYCYWTIPADYSDLALERICECVMCESPSIQHNNERIVLFCYILFPYQFKWQTKTYLYAYGFVFILNGLEHWQLMANKNICFTPHWYGPIRSISDADFVDATNEKRAPQL